MSEFRCVHCGWKGDYVDVWGNQGDVWLDSDCPLTEKECQDDWCSWHGCATEVIGEETDLNSNFWKRELNRPESWAYGRDIKTSSYKWIICKVCHKEESK